MVDACLHLLLLLPACGPVPSQLLPLYSELLQPVSQFDEYGVSIEFWAIQRVFIDLESYAVRNRSQEGVPGRAICTVIIYKFLFHVLDQVVHLLVSDDRLDEALGSGAAGVGVLVGHAGAVLLRGRHRLCCHCFFLI